jgi:diguanylate cyclase (GGDEF)-like protein
MNQAQLDNLRQQLDSKGVRLRFPDPLEAEFQADYATRYLRHMQLAMMLGIFGLISCGIIDWLWMPAVASKMWTVRLLLAAPMLVFLLVSRSQAGGQRMQLLTLLAAITGSAMIVICSTIAPEPFPHYYRCGLILVILIVFVLSRLQFSWGLATAAVILAELNLGLLFSGVSLIIFAAANFVVVAALVFGLIGTFLIERSLRQNYLQSRLLSFENHGLEESNLRLQYLTAIDGLTQLANRRSLDTSLSTEWQRALRKQEPLALIMIDVDHFKLFNDQYGHQAGDECLRGVAGAIKDVARRPGDLAARYGGEEFCIVLTGASASHATQVAERARDKIVQLAIPHHKSSHGQVTASFGVASAIPTSDTGPEVLLLAADQALYQAKKEGRNRVALAGKKASEATEEEMA